MDAGFHERHSCKLDGKELNDKAFVSHFCGTSSKIML